jgi:hypothetical protein
MFSYFLGGPVQFLAMYVSFRGPTRKVLPPALCIDRQVPTNLFSRLASPQEVNAIIKSNKNADFVFIIFLFEQRKVQLAAWIGAESCSQGFLLIK